MHFKRFCDEGLQETRGTSILIHGGNALGGIIVIMRLAAKLAIDIDGVRCIANLGGDGRDHTAEGGGCWGCHRCRWADGWAGVERGSKLRGKKQFVNKICDRGYNGNGGLWIA